MSLSLGAPLLSSPWSIAASTNLFLKGECDLFLFFVAFLVIVCCDWLTAKGVGVVIGWSASWERVGVMVYACKGECGNGSKTNHY